MSSTVYVTSDHGGWALKQRLVVWLKKTGVQAVDIGPEKLDPKDDYPVWTARVVKLVQRDPGSRAIVLCRSGVGMALVANKFSGIRAVQGWNPNVAMRSRQDEDANVLSLAADYQPWANVQAVTKKWLQTKFSPKMNYRRRLSQIRRIERDK